jgi:hypothetical protein
MIVYLPGTTLTIRTSFQFYKMPNRIAKAMVLHPLPCSVLTAAILPLMAKSDVDVIVEFAEPTGG